MTTHAMSCDAHFARVQLLERAKECSRELIRDVAVHLVAFNPGLLCCVDVEACAGTKVVGIIFTLDLETTWKKPSAKWYATFRDKQMFFML